MSQLPNDRWFVFQSCEKVAPSMYCILEIHVADVEKIDPSSSESYKYRIFCHHGNLSKVQVCQSFPPSLISKAEGKSNLNILVLNSLISI